MSPPPPTRHVHAPRNFVRRSATFLAAVVLVGGVPLAAQALTEEPIDEPGPVAAGSFSITAPASAEAAARPFSVARQIPVARANSATRLDSGIPDLGVDIEPATEPVDVPPAPEAAPSVTDALPPEPTPAPVVAPPGTSASQWAALRECESGGDYSITNPSGKYRGAYQFDRSTWNSIAERHAPALVGVDPASASPADQDALAFALYSERGARPWPHCGRHLR